jgi:hypothetical protein
MTCFQSIPHPFLFLILINVTKLLETPPFENSFYSAFSYVPAILSLTFGRLGNMLQTLVLSFWVNVLNLKIRMNCLLIFEEKGTNYCGKV